MRENFEYDENSINSISSYNKSPYNIDPPKRNFFKEQSTFNQENNTTNFESSMNSFTKIPSNNKTNYYNQYYQQSNFKSPSNVYHENRNMNNYFPEEENKGYKRNLTINEFIPENTTTWNKILDFFFSW